VNPTTIVSMRVSRSNVPKAALRWSIEKAGHEFGLASQTLRKALAKSSAAPDRDGMFSTKQIVAALYGSMHIEKLATQKELRKKLELENAITTGSVLDRAELTRVLAAVADAMTTRIMSSDVSRSVKEDLLKELSTVPLILKDVAHRQSRLQHGNDTRNRNDGSED
jgi:hypothetical protein